MTEHELKMLRILAGEEKLEYWGAWCTAVLESLVGKGYAVPSYEITDEGLEALRADR